MVDRTVQARRDNLVRAYFRREATGWRCRRCYELVAPQGPGSHVVMRAHRESCRLGAARGRMQA